MAATRIWSIKGRLDSVINYVTNPEKTDGGRYTDTELQALTDVIDYAEDEAKTHNKVYGATAQLPKQKKCDIIGAWKDK